jgi:CheY-like chemotaxis protein
MDGLEASIEVKSSKGLGTVFTLGLGKTSKLGLVDVAPQPNDNKDITAKTSKPKILIVEDDETSQLYIEMVLKNSYDTFVAASSSEAIEMLYQQAVDLVLMDISLRGSMNGLELTRWIRSSAKHSEIPIIAVTAHAFEADRGMALEAGCNQFIAKPFKSAELLRAIQQVLF